MSFRDCLNDIRGAFDGSLSDEAIMEILEEFDAVARATAEQRPWANVQTELFGHGEKLAKQARERILIERRNRSMNNRKEAALRAFLEDPAWAKDPNAAVTAKAFGALGFEAQGGKASVHRQGVALGRFWIGSLDNALTKADLMPAVQRGALDRQIAAEMWELGKRNGKPGVTGSKEALEAAKIIHRLQENMVARLNRAGAFIRRMPGYIVRQTHDMRLVGKAGFDAWYKDTWPKIDEMRTFNRILADDEREAIYRRLFNELSSGRHPSALADQAWQAFLPSGGNLAKRVSQSRELHFRTGGDWYDYHSKYGRGTILEAVASSAQTNGRAVALMETFGSNPKAMLERFMAEADDRAAAIGAPTSDAANRFSAATIWGIVSGESNRPAANWLARLGNAARATQVASKLGSAVLSAFLSDPKLQANELARHGVPFLRRAMLPWQNVIRMAVESGEQRRLANMLQAYRDGMLMELWGRYDTGDGLPGVATWFAQKTMKLSGMNRWTSASKGNVVAVISHEMADRAGTAFDALDPEYRKLLGAYGITADDWGRLGSAQVEVEGVRYVVPHQLKLDGFGDLSTPEGRRGARRARDELATKLITFIDDRMAAALNEPGARTRALLVGDSRPGTWRGEFWRAATLFKSFPVEMHTRVYGEKIANGEYSSLASLVLTMTVLGGVLNVVRDAARGIAPPDYAELEPSQWGQVFLRAALSGGGLGIMGDFALGEYNRYGRSMVATQAGPVLGQLDSAAGIYAALVRADGEDAAGKAFEFFYRNMPFVNLWWARQTFDYFILYQMQEYMNPGYLRRMEQRREKETGQRFILAPSEVVGR